MDVGPKVQSLKEYMAQGMDGLSALIMSAIDKIGGGISSGISMIDDAIGRATGGSTTSFSTAAVAPGTEPTVTITAPTMSPGVSVSQQQYLQPETPSMSFGDMVSRAETVLSGIMPPHMMAAAREAVQQVMPPTMVNEFQTTAMVADRGNLGYALETATTGFNTQVTMQVGGPGIGA